MHSIYSYIPDTNHVPREYSVAAILLFLFMVHISLAPVLNLLHFHISTFRNVCVCAVPKMDVFCNSLISCFPGTFLKYFLNDSEMVLLSLYNFTLFIIVIIIIIVVVWRFGPLSGHVLSVVEISRQRTFYDVRISTPWPTPKPECQGISLRPAIRSKSIRRGATSSQAVAGIAVVSVGWSVAKSPVSTRSHPTVLTEPSWLL
jgi:hypothetical protein